MGISGMDINVDLMGGHEFNDYCAELLRLNGYEDVEVTKKSGDNGADIICKKYGKKYAIQCKRQKENVGFKALQEIYTAKTIYKCDIAVVMTNAKFTKSAYENAKKLNVKLWDNKKIIKLHEVAFANNVAEAGNAEKTEKNITEYNILNEKKSNSIVSEDKKSEGCSGCAVAVLFFIIIFSIVLSNFLDNYRLPNFLVNFVSELQNIYRFLYENIIVVIVWGLFFVYGLVRKKWGIVIIVVLLSLVALYFGLWA